jgi:hypothetical protein
MIFGELGNGLASARAATSLSAGTSGCTIFRSAAPAGMARDTTTTSNGNIPVFITLLL